MKRYNFHNLKIQLIQPKNYNTWYCNCGFRSIYIYTNIDAIVFSFINHVGVSIHHEYKNK